MPFRMLVGLFASGLLLCSQLLWPHQAAGAARPWSLVVVPEPGVPADLYDITCVAASDCWAVGTDFPPGGGFHPFTEHWDGATWTLGALPSPTGDDVISGVGCADVRDCWAVGQEGTGGSLIEHFDGAVWSVVPSGQSGFGWLSAITCVSSTDCWAVGSFLDHFDGSAWSTSPQPLPRGYTNAVACVSSADCWAGFRDTSSAHHSAVMLHFDGGTWRIGQRLGRDMTTGGIACIDSSDCWAAAGVRGADVNSIIEHFDGRAWALYKQPQDLSSAMGAALNDVACNGRGCFAVGEVLYDFAHGWQPMAERLSGHSWHVERTSLAGTALRSIACTSAHCWALGRSNPSDPGFFVAEN